MSYADEVFRYGGRTPQMDAEGNRRKLNQKTSFYPTDVKTDGMGNITDMPLLIRKHCFARPETYLQFAIYDRQTFAHKSGKVLPRYNQCDNCPVLPACQMVVLERLESDPAIQKAHCTFDDLVRDVKQSPFLHSQHVRAWSCFLHVLKAHGGWSTVNDARVSAAAVLKKQERDADRREGARMVRRNRAAARRKAPPPFVATPSFMIALDNEFDRRLGILLDLRSRRDSPRWINKLDSVGCSRTAEVWRARAILTRTGCPPTGSNIAELLLRDSRVEVTPPTTLTTVAYRDLKRIRKLEDNAAGLAIWGAFDPRC